jgi:hypothetical protein
MSPFCANAGTAKQKREKKRYVRISSGVAYYGCHWIHGLVQAGTGWAFESAACHSHAFDRPMACEGRSPNCMADEENMADEEVNCC